MRRKEIDNNNSDGKGRSRIIKLGGTVLAAVILATGIWSVNQETDEITIPQTVEFVDTEDGSVIVEEEEVPLATKPTVKVKTTTKKSVKKNKLKTKAKKSKKVTKRSTTKRTKTTENTSKKVKTETTVNKTVLTQTKKKSKIQTVTTTVKTTVKTTTTNKPKSTTTKTTTTTSTAAVASSSSSSSTVTTIVMRNLATAAHANVLEAYELMGFTTEINPSKSYSGYFSAVDHKIIMQSKKASTAYHELGHFVAWLAGNVDTKSEFVAIYNSEKDSVTGSNKAYLTKNSSEYFAESYREYVMSPTTLQQNRPQTYAYMQTAVSKITTARAQSIKNYYDEVYWK